MAEAWRQFDTNATLPANCLLGPTAWCVNGKGEKDRIVLDERVVCRGLLRVESYGDGRIHAAPNAYIGDDCLISSAAGVEIGEHALLAHGVHIFDNDTHPLDWRVRLEDIRAITRRNTDKPAIESAPVKIGAHTWIGLNSIVLKGITIGERSIIGASSVVTKDVPDDVLVAGNPARVIRRLGDVLAPETSTPAR